MDVDSGSAGIEKGAQFGVVTPLPPPKPALVVLDAEGRVDPLKSLEACESYANEVAGRLVEGWDGNARKGIAKVDALVMAELRGAIGELGKAAIRAVQARR